MNDNHLDVRGRNAAESKLDYEIMLLWREPYLAKWLRLLFIAWDSQCIRPTP